MRIMVVDDNELLAMTLAELVRAHGHEATECYDGEQALAAYRKEPFDLVLVDQVMPGMDGTTLTHRLRQLQQQTGWRPILMVSAASSADEQVTALMAGCDDFLPKPVNAPVLAAKIAAFSRIFQLQQQLASRNLQLQEMQAEREEQGRVAEQLMNRLLMRAEIDRRVLQHFVRATQQLSGDLVMATCSDTGDRYIMLADATGHGLPAALTQIPLSQTFYAMAASGFGLVSIVAEMNKQHRRYAPVYRSVAALLAVHRLSEQTLEVWNGGMPEALLLGEGGKILRSFASRNLPLGIESDINYYRDTEVVMLNQPCHLLFYSDGVQEAENDQGEWFGSHGISRALASAATADDYAQSLQRAVDEHLQGRAAHDDISCLVLDCSANYCSLAPEAVATSNPQPAKGDEYWRLQVDLGALQLRQMDLVPILCGWLRQLGVAQQESGRLSLILAELVANAIEHGLLHLDSALKNDVDGFERYTQLRRERLDVLNSGMLRIEISQKGSDAPLCIALGDSGAGFDWQQRAIASDKPLYHGRGLMLVRALSQRLEFRGAGNEVYVELAPTRPHAGDGGPTHVEQP